MNRVLILFLSIVLFMVGCNSEKPEVEYALEDLKEYFNIRYSELTAENFAKRSEKMNAYYSDELLSSDSWLLDPLNYESTLHTLEENGIETEIVYLDIKHEKNHVYNTGIIVKYNTAHSEHSYCAEYRFKVTYENNEIMDIERIAYNIIVVGDSDYSISNGKVVMQ